MKEETILKRVNERDISVVPELLAAFSALVVGAERRFKLADLALDDTYRSDLDYRLIKAVRELSTPFANWGAIAKWMTLTVSGAALDLLRKQSRRRETVLDERIAYEPEAQPAASDDALAERYQEIREEKTDRIHALLNLFDERERNVLRAMSTHLTRHHAVTELGEVKRLAAEELGLGVRSVDNIWSSASRKLKELPELTEALAATHLDDLDEKERTKVVNRFAIQMTRVLFDD